MALPGNGFQRTFSLKTGLVFFITVGLLGRLTAGFIRFKSDTEYQYSFHSSTDLKQVRAIHAECKVGFVLVKSSDDSGDSHQIYLRVHSAVITSGDDQVLLSEEKDFNEWFSFDLSEKGAIGQVYYPRDEDEHVIVTKKGIASLLAANLQHPPAGQMNQPGWSYECNETGHEGHHEASYKAQVAPGIDGIIVFTKTRRTHLIPYGKSKHQKEIHYHPGMQLPTVVKILDHFQAPTKTAAVFPSHVYTNGEEEDDVVLPEMQSFSEGQLTFERTVYYQSPRAPSSDEDLVIDSIHVKKIPDRHLNEDILALKEFITGNLTCMRTASLEGSHERSHCFQALVETLLSVPDAKKLAELVAPFYKLPLSRRLRDKANRLNLLDAVASMHSDASQSLLTDLILLSPIPNKELVERLLIASAGFIHTVSQHYLETVESIIFKPADFPKSLRDSEIQRVAVLALGALAGHLWQVGHKTQAEGIVIKIEERLGIHDPWEYDKTLQSLSKDKQDELHHDTVAWIEALGNAGLQRSFSHIQSYTNSSTAHPLLKRAGLHALRDYHHDMAADILLQSALDEDGEEHVRYEASLLYRDHPNSIYKNITKFVNPEGSNFSEVESAEMVSVPSRHRLRRSIWDGIHFKLASPSVKWEKKLGSSAAGAVFGLTIKNELDVKIAPLSGHLRVNIYDDAYATILVGMVGQTLDVARARFCFIGHAEYDLNILQEFGVGRISALAEAYNLNIRQVVGNIQRAVNIWAGLFNGNPGIAQLFDDFAQTLETIPDRISNVRSVSVAAVARLAQFDPDQLPPSFQGVSSVVRRAAQLLSDIKTDVMEFYMTINEAITVTLPSASDRIWASVQAIGESIGDLLSTPLKAIGNIFKGVLNIKMAVDAILDAKMQIEHANLLQEGQRPYWFDLPKVTSHMLRELRDHLMTITTDLGVWVDKAANSTDDPIKKLTGGSIDLYTLRRLVKDEIESVFRELIGHIQPLDNLLSPFFELYDIVFDTIKAIKEAYQTLKTGYHESQSLVVKLFGPKAHQVFPRKYRSPGSGACASGGFYPSDVTGEPGVDLEIPQGAVVVAPFSGVIFKTAGKSNQVTLQAGGGAFTNIKIYISNIKPNDTISESSGIEVIAGTPIGTAAYATTCSPPNYIHLSMKKSKPDRLASILTLGDEPTATDLAAKEGYVDPSDYLPKRPMVIPQWKQVCDDYRIVWRAKTVKEGSMLGRDKQGELIDTTPELTTPDTTTAKLDPSMRPPRQSSPLDEAVTPGNLQHTKEALGLPNIRLGSGSPFKNFTMRNLEIGSILAFARRLGLEKTADDLLNVVKAIANLVSNKPCVIPESLTNDMLRMELQQRGLSSQGDRKTLLRRYRQPEDRCIHLHVSLPKNVYCRFDEACLGVECCMDVRLALVSLAFKAFMRFDPCELQFVLGINSWNYTIQILEDEWSKEIDEPVPFDIPFFDDMELRLRYGIEKTRTELLVSMSVGFCPKTGDAGCLKSIDILRDSVIPLPVCNPDGTFTWPDIDIQEYLSRAALKKVIKETGEELLETGKELLLERVLQLLNISKDLLLGGRGECQTPKRMSATRLRSALEERGLDITGTRTDQEFRLSLDDRTCHLFTLPPFPPEVAQLAYCSLSEDCLSLDCCLDLHIQTLDFHRSLRVSLEIDVCDFTLIIGFQHFQYKRLLLSYAWGEDQYKRIGSSAFQLRYSISKLDMERVFEIDFGASTCPNGEDCIFDVDIIQDYRVPIPACKSNFSLALPGAVTFHEFVMQVGRNAGQQAVNVLLEYIGLRGKISNDPCDAAALVTGDEEECTDVTFPSLSTLLTCNLSHRCLGVRCCVELDLKVTVLSVNVWMTLDPCEFKLSIGFGGWSATFTLFDYHWGTQEVISIGKAIKLVYTINKLTADEVFVMDLALSLCLPDSECDAPSIVILRGLRVPVPLCHENGTFVLPGDGTVAGFLQVVGQNVAESTVEAILYSLGLSEYFGRVPCDGPQVTSDGWQRVCPRDVTLPHLPGNLVCTLPEKCLGFKCCLALPIPGIPPFSTRFSFVFDPCDYQMSLSLGSWRRDLEVFSYQWGQQEEFHVGNPFTLSMSIDKSDAGESFLINLDLSFCLDGVCTITPVLSDALVPIPICNLDDSFELPGDGSFTAFAQSLGRNVGELAVQAGLRKLGIQQYVSNQQCNMQILAAAENRCPLLRLPAPTGKLTCTVDDSCLGVQCCASVDLIFTQLTTATWAVLDPCTSRLSIGLGSWSEHMTLIERDWGVEKMVDISDAVHIMYTVDKLAEQKEFLIDLSITLCIDGTCRPINLLQGAQVPIPVCNPNVTLSLPGDGTIAGYLATLGGHITEAAVDTVLDFLNLKSFLSREACTLPPVSVTDSDRCPVQFPNLPHSTCQINSRCTSLKCCLTLDLQVGMFSCSAWFEIDPCAHKISVGLDRWYLNVSLFAYEWGKMESFHIGNAINVRFAIDKLDATDEYEVDLAFSLHTDNTTTDYPILAGARIPIPVCNANFSLTLPGDGTVRGFLEELGDNVGQIAIQLVLRELHLQDIVTGGRCDIPAEMRTNTNCPTISLPFLEDIVQCSVDDRCLSIQCCVNLDFVITRLMLSAKVILDPCNFQLYVAFESWERNLTLFSYTWGTTKSEQLGSVATLSYSVDRLMGNKVFSVTLNIGLCIDGTCILTPVLDHVWVPMPLCSTNVTSFTLPGDGTVAGFIQELGGEIGTSAIELVLEKYGLDQYLQSTKCDSRMESSLRSGCPDFDVAGIPDSVSCAISDSCLGLSCCLEMDLKIVTRAITAWVTLDPCNFNISIGFEKWQRSITLFHYPLGDVMEEVVSSLLKIQWRVAKITENKQFEVDLSLVLCVDGACNTLTVFEGSRLPMPLCNTEDPFVLPGDGTVSGFLSYLGGNIGQFAVDAAIRHLNLGNLLTGKACSLQGQGVCSNFTGFLGNCSVIGEACTELRCCLDLDLQIADLSATAWFKFDPCDFTFTLGLERWLFEGSIFSYQWGEQMTVALTPDTHLKFSINKLEDTTEFEVNMTLVYCIDGLCSDIDMQCNVPIPLCRADFTNYTLPVDGFVETKSGDVIQGASLPLLSQLGISPDFFSSEPCAVPNVTVPHLHCPGMQFPAGLASPVDCGILSTCFGVHCCLDVNLGPLSHEVAASVAIDPCLGQLALQFDNWQYTKSLSQQDFDTSREVTIGNFVSLRYTLRLLGGELSVSLSLEACVGDHCTGGIVVLDGAVTPLPMCYPNGTISWRSLPGLTLDSQLDRFDVGLEVVAQALGLPSHLVLASPCLATIMPTQSGACPHLPDPPFLPSGGVCHYADACLGVECCLAVDLGLNNRTLRTWLVVDPCDFRLRIGFENWSYNVTLMSYKWGKPMREQLSEVVSLAFTIGKTLNNRNFLLSLAVQLCTNGVCAPDVVILQDFVAPIPFCSSDGTFYWAASLGGNVEDYADALVVNSLGVSADVLLPQPCIGPPAQVVPPTTGCSSVSLPPSVTPHCSLDEMCLGVGCCLNFDLGIVQRSFALWVKLDPCLLRFFFSFEKWNYSEVINVQPMQTHSNEKYIGIVKIRYDIGRPHATVYDLSLDVIVCLEGTCAEPLAILQGATFSGSRCTGQDGGNGSRSDRRHVEEISSEFLEVLDDTKEEIGNSVDSAGRYFRNLLKANVSMLSATDYIMLKLQPDKVVLPRVAGSGTASRRAMGLLLFGDEDEVPITKRTTRDVTSSGGASLFGLSLPPGADSGTWQGLTIIGGGLTQKGLDALGSRIANMTIGELEAMLDLQNIDPVAMVQLMKNLRSLYRNFVDEFIDVSISGVAKNMFSEFDVVFSKVISFPRVRAVFFRYWYGTVVSILWLEFNVQAGGFFDMEIPIHIGLVSMTASGGIKPMVGTYVRASVTIGNTLWGQLILTADVLDTRFPTLAEISFAKFPLDVGLRMDTQMIPLIIRLKAKVTLKIPFFGRKTLYDSELWRYDAPSIWKNIFNTHKQDPDASPPEISEYSTPVSGIARRGVARSNKCGVEQVPGLDHTEPAFQLEVAASDDKSIVTFFYQIGTAPGSSEVVSQTEFGGPSAIISQILYGGHPLHFTVFAVNSGGGTSMATCSLPTFDITLPTGRITPNFRSTSHPHLLRASTVVYDDSIILVQNEGVGFGVGIWGDQIVPWHTIDLTEREHFGTSVNDFDFFTVGQQGRLISPPTSTITHRNPNFCARDCRALPETKCLSFNYNYQDFTCELLEEIEGHGVEIHESGHFTHFERLGVGHAVEFSHDSLQLDHNHLYYFNVELLNYVGYTNIISSLPVIVDFTTPAPGLIVNETRDELVHEPCLDFTPEEWERRCIEDTPLDNHRYIIDGPGSMTVFNGYEALVDMLYTRSNTFITANWDGFHDNETSIHGYTWSVSYSVCGDDVSMHIDPHAHLFDESEWTHQGLVTNINLADGAYFITVRALNKVEFGGPMALSVCHSTPLIIDTSPPIIYSISSITYDSSIGRIGMQINADDPESHLLEYHVTAGKTQNGNLLRDWEMFAPDKQLFIDFKIPNGVPCWMILRAVNNVDLWSVDHADQPILVDDTPPIAGDLFDGPFAGQDLVFSKDRNKICANWYGWSDPESGILSYLWAVGTRPRLNDIVDYVKLSYQEHLACSGYVTLQHGETYYSTLTAFHRGYDKLNVSASSNGVMIDLTPPMPGSIFDGLLSGPTNLNFSSEPATVAAHWAGFSDPESGIEDYQVAVYRKHHDSANTSSEFEVIHKAEAVGKETSSIEWHHFHLRHKDQISVNLRTINQALNHVDTMTDGFLVDLTPPVLQTLGDGLVEGQDADFQSHTDSLAVHWDYIDAESSIEFFELAIYEIEEGTEHKIFPMDMNPNSFERIMDVTAKSHVQSGLTLQAGAIYFTRVLARNQAKLVASHETNGIRVDPTPPVMRYVRGGNLNGKAEETINGYVYQNSLTTIQASWLAVDAESGIKNYWVAVGTAPYSEDIRAFTPRGPQKDGVLSNLDLQLTNESTCSDEEFTEDCQPVYYVCAKSENGAGAFSDAVCSSPIRVLEEDQTGHVTDGPDMLQDVDAQQEKTTVTVWFKDFQSQLHGISHYEWAVGTAPGGEDIQPLTADGIVPAMDEEVAALAGRGKAQSPLPLQHGVTYYSTLQAITNGGNVLESVSNGFKVDSTPPEIMITNLGQYDSGIGLNLTGGVRLYQFKDDSIDAMWDISEEESDIVATYFSMGQYPGGSNIYPSASTNMSHIPPSVIRPALEGLPNILTVHAINSVGLRQTAHATSMTVDTSPPSVGQVQCPAFLHANSAFSCSWSGFLDAESGISHFRLLVGTAEGLGDVFQSEELAGHLTHYSVGDLDLIHNKVYYVTVEAFNAVGQSMLAFSDPIEIDDTPPTYGVVVELSGVLRLNFSDPDNSQPEWDCLDEEDCLHLDGECLESVTQLEILWQPFTDEDTRITKYEVALGTTPGGSQIKPFYEVPSGQTSELITNIDLSDVRVVYATVRGYNEAGLASMTVSNGIYVSLYSAGLEPLRPLQVKDGVTETDLPDADYQTFLNELSASWDFSGDPCPIKKYEWAIYRIDGQEVQPLTDVGGQTSDTNTDIQMVDGETYYSVVRATNALGLVITVRSDGITVQREPLIPGQVYDGPLAGFDLVYQKETDIISASWNGFGQGMPPKKAVQHTGNAEVLKGLSAQDVDYYEAAVGTDRRFPKTRDNVVPYTNVGQNTTVTFRNLDLNALDSTFYVTVRAYSASFSKAEVTSNGIRVGVDSTVHATEVETSEYINSLTEVQLQWGEFKSQFPILLYSVGLGKPYPSSMPPDEMDCLDMLLVTKQSRATFNEREMQFVGKDTYVKVTGLDLSQEGLYFVTVVGVNEAGQCNSSTSDFSVDVTPPVEGQLRSGPFYGMPVAYTESTDFVPVVWEGFRDDQSGIKSFKVRLVEAASCDAGDRDNLTVVADQEWLMLGPYISDFTFVGLSLETAHPYFVQLVAVNHAGGSTQSQVGPIFVDTSSPTAGLVVDGLDFKMDLTDSGDRSQVSGTFLHLANPAGAPCPLNDIPFTDSQWSALDSKGLWNMNSDKWDIEYHPSQVFVSDESLTLKMERDTRGPRMLSGAYVINAQIAGSSEYEFDLMAASPDLHSVTSILFWDGPDGAIGEFDFAGPENWQDGICACCYVQLLNQSACSHCNCVEFLGMTLPADMNSTFANTSDDPMYSSPMVPQTVHETVNLVTSELTNETAVAQEAKVTDGNSTAGMATMASPRTTREDSQSGGSISDEGPAERFVPQRACGFQLYPNGDASQAVLWCRFLNNEWPMMSQAVDLDFDPSVQERHYSVHFTVMPFSADEDLWSFEVYVDGELLSSLTGIPDMSSSTKLVLHVFNQDNYITYLDDPFNPPAVTATLRNLRMPPDISELCRYGLPFRAGTSPVSRYFAGVGTEAGATDTVPFEEVGRPCVPCISPCDYYQCDVSCPTDAVPITFTLTNLALPTLELVNVTSNGTNSTAPNTREDGVLLPFVLTVKSVLGNGHSVTASSNGFYVDDTPAELDMFFYIDINVNDYQPTWYQSSNTTIKVLWSFVDMQSKVKEHYWAIGTSPGATDLQDFVSVGLNQTGTNSNLMGLLHHNTTYYVTLRAINGAGLETLVECDGVTILLEEPHADDVNTTSMFSQQFEEQVYPADAERAEDPTKTGTSWSQPEDKSINRYEYCVSSSVELLDDVVPCMVVGTNSSGSVAIEGGLIILTAQDREEKYNITDFQATTKNSYQQTAKKRKATFNMEPGKCLHTWMKMCNRALLCVTKSAGTTMILGDSDLMMTSQDGADLVLTSPTSQRRRKRAADNHFEFSVASTGGLHKGGSLILGLLDGNRTSEEFTSDASPDYKPYITDPQYTIHQTSRLLRNRIGFVYEPTFFVTSLGQTELWGPMMITVTLSTTCDWTEAKPRLIYWHSGNGEWHDVAKTCGNSHDGITYDLEENQFTVKVCATRDPTSSPLTASRDRRASEDVTPAGSVFYFSHETQFAVGEVTDAIPNSPPEITNPVGTLFMAEDEGTLVYTFQASDPEYDVFIFELGFDETLQGTASITEDGEFCFTPCADCHGTSTLQVTVREIQTESDIDPLSTTVNLSVTVQPVNDNPIVYIAQNGRVAGNGRMAVLTVEQQTGSNVAYKDLVAELGAFDVDIDDNLTLVTQLPNFGKFTLEAGLKPSASVQNCDEPSDDNEDLVVPCGLDLLHDVADMSWTVSKLTYAPNPGYHGRNSFRVLARDQSSAVSQLLEVQIAVLVNPCINNGVCGGPKEDPNCTSPARSSGFESYFCLCEPGWVGDICETDYDECQSSPCEYPYACFDHLNAFKCACPLSDPMCDGPDWRIKVITGVTCTVFVLCVAALVFCLWRKKYIKTYRLHKSKNYQSLQRSDHFKGRVEMKQAFLNPTFVADGGDHTDADSDNMPSSSNQDNFTSCSSDCKASSAYASDESPDAMSVPLPAEHWPEPMMPIQNPGIFEDDVGDEEEANIPVESNTVMTDVPLHDNKSPESANFKALSAYASDESPDALSMPLPAEHWPEPMMPIQNPDIFEDDAGDEEEVNIPVESNTVMTEASTGDAESPDPSPPETPTTLISESPFDRLDSSETLAESTVPILSPGSPNDSAKAMEGEDGLHLREVSPMPIEERASHDVEHRGQMKEEDYSAKDEDETTV